MFDKFRVDFFQKNYRKMSLFVIICKNINFLLSIEHFIKFAKNFLFLIAKNILLMDLDIFIKFLSPVYLKKYKLTIYLVKTLIC